MIHKECVFLGHNETVLYWQCWQPESPPKGTVIFVHDLGDHSSRHSNLISHITGQGYTAYAYDSRGNGLSQGKRGHIDSWDQVRSDLREFVRLAEIHAPSGPLFLLGFSMGGLTVLEYVLHYPERFSGVIAISPILGNIAVHPALMALGRVMSKIMPAFTVDTRNSQWISRDDAISQAFISDRLSHGKASARMGTESESAAAWTRARAHELAIPLLIMHGSANRIADPAVSREFFNKVRINDKQYRLYEGAYHELDNEVNKKDVLRDLTDWLDRHAHHALSDPLHENAFALDDQQNVLA